jgi:hypothetical protein
MDTTTMVGLGTLIAFGVSTLVSIVSLFFIISVWRKIKSMEDSEVNPMPILPTMQRVEPQQEMQPIEQPTKYPKIKPMRKPKVPEFDPYEAELESLKEKYGRK